MDNYYLQQYEDFVKKVDKTTSSRDYVCDMHYVTGLCAEAGEVSALFQKEIRKDGICDVFIHRQELMNELGDVLWYLTRLANHHDISLQEVIENNVAKLKERHNES